MTERWKDIFIIITLGVIAILATSWLIDILLIDGLKVDKGFLGSVLGGIIGALGVIGTTYFLIEANKEQTLRAASMHDQTERDRYYLQLVITNSEDTLVRLSKLKDNLREYKRLVSVSNRIIRISITIVRRIKQINDENKVIDYTSLEDLFEKKDRMEELFIENLNKINQEKEQINQILIILNSRKDLYNGIILSELYKSFGKYSEEIGQLFNDSIYEEGNWEGTYRKINDIINNDLESLLFTATFAIDDLFSQIEGAILKLKDGTTSN